MDQEQQQQEEQQDQQQQENTHTVDDREEVIENQEQEQQEKSPKDDDDDDDDDQQQQEQQKPKQQQQQQKVALFVLFQHGSHGRPGALRYLKERMMKEFVLKCDRIAAVKFFDTKVNSFFSSDDGTVICGERLCKEMTPEMEKFADEHEKNNLHLVFSIVSLSFGGIIAREVTFRLQTFHKKLSDRYEWDMFCSIASPHTGVTELPNWKKGLGKFIGWCFSKTYDELLLTDNLFYTYMIDDAHINAMKVWKTRLLIANVSADRLVAFGTSSLMMDDKERTKNLEETKMATATVSGVMNLTAPMNPVADTNTADADMLAQAVVAEEEKEEQKQQNQQNDNNSTNNNNNNSGENVSSPVEQSAGKKEAEKDEHSIAKKIADRLRKELDWQVVAVKPDSFFETAHHAVVGSSWISKPIDDAMDRIGDRLVKPFGGRKVEERQQDISTPANVAMPATA